jgi:hypothetical protein
MARAITGIYTNKQFSSSTFNLQVKCENLVISVEEIVRVYENEYTDQGCVGGECVIGYRNLMPSFKGDPRCYGIKILRLLG